MYRRIILGFESCLAVAAGVLLAQAPAASPVAFEVAVVRPAPPIEELFKQYQGTNKTKFGVIVDGDRVDIAYISLEDLVLTAYNLKAYQIQGPEWMTQPRFEIHAKMPNGVSKDRVPEMLQALLADRFKLTVHKEKRDQPVYALIIGKNGARLKEAAGLTEAAPEPAVPAGAADGAQAPQFQFKNSPNGTVMQYGNQRVTISSGPGGVHQEIDRITMAAFANSIAAYVDKPVIDMTGLAGEYQVALDISSDDLRRTTQKAQQMMAELGLPPLAQPTPAANPGEASAPAGGSIFGSLEKLGLKLEARKAPLDILVIDHLEKTSTDN